MNVEEPQQVISPRATTNFWLRPWTMLLVSLVLLSSFALFSEWGIVVFGLSLALAMCVRQFESRPPVTYPALLVAVVLWLIGVLVPVINTPRKSYRRDGCHNNLKQIAAALQNYRQANGCFPPAYIADRSGKPMHSWRVLILPFLEENALYETYNFAEPWDGPNNGKLLVSRPSQYVCPGDPSAFSQGAPLTTYLAVVGRNTAWEREKSGMVRSMDLSSASNTIMLIEVTNLGVAWTEPRDLSLDALIMSGTKSPALSSSSNHGRQEDFFFSYDYSSSVSVLLADGTVRDLRLASLSAEDIQRMLQIDGCSENELSSHGALFDPERRINWRNIVALAVWLSSIGALMNHAVRNMRGKVRPGPPTLDNMREARRTTQGRIFEEI